MMKFNYTGVEEVPILEMSSEDGTIAMMMPHRPANALSYVEEVLNSRWIGQGPKVKRFEEIFHETLLSNRGAVSSVGSGTDALHLAYLLAGLKEGDEVVSPVFTCTATNIPLLYIGANIKFADIEPGSLNISVDHVRKLVNNNTKAIVTVDYGGEPSKIRELREISEKYGIPIIQDAAQSLGASRDGEPVGTSADFTTFSFQAVKHITTGDGGMLVMKDPLMKPLADRLRWFGIDRSAKQKGIWENDITEIGFKYQMTDVSAALGIAGLEELDQVLSHRRRLVSTYTELLASNSAVEILGYGGVPLQNHGAWLFTVAVEKRRKLQEKLLANGIESNQVHYRNDKYAIFGGSRQPMPNMDLIEEKYLVLPLHTSMDESHVRRICGVINAGW